MIDYPEAIVIDINDESNIHGKVVAVINTDYDTELAKNKLICCLSVLITSFVMVAFGYIVIP